MSHRVTPTFPDVGDFTSETPDSGAVLRPLTLRGGIMCVTLTRTSRDEIYQA